MNARCLLPVSSGSGPLATVIRIIGLMCAFSLIWMFADVRRAAFAQGMGGPDAPASAEAEEETMGMCWDDGKEAHVPCPSDRPAESGAGGHATGICWDVRVQDYRPCETVPEGNSTILETPTSVCWDTREQTHVKCGTDPVVPPEQETPRPKR